MTNEGPALKGQGDEAHRVAPPADPAAQAWLSVAEAWMLHGEPLAPGLPEAEAALVTAREVDEPILLSAAMDGVSAALLNARRYRDAYRLNRQRMDLFSRLDRQDPRAASEIDDTISVLIDSGCAAGELGETLEAVLVAFSADVAGPRQAHAARDAERLWSDWIAAGRPFAGWMVPPVLAVVLTHGLRGHATAEEEWLRRAAELTRSGDPLRDRIAGAFATFVLARIALHKGHVADAAALTDDYVRDPPAARSGPLSYYDAYPRALAAEIAAVAGSPEAEVLIAAVAEAAAENRWASACVDRALGRLRGERAVLERAAAGFRAIGARFEAACALLLLPRTRPMASPPFARSAARCPIWGRKRAEPVNLVAAAVRRGRSSGCRARLALLIRALLEQRVSGIGLDLTAMGSASGWGRHRARPTARWRRWHRRRWTAGSPRRSSTARASATRRVSPAPTRRRPWPGRSACRHARRPRSAGRRS